MPAAGAASCPTLIMSSSIHFIGGRDLLCHYMAFLRYMCAFAAFTVVNSLANRPRRGFGASGYWMDSGARWRPQQWRIGCTKLAGSVRAPLSYNRGGESMGRFDIPELLIGVSILAILVWAAYNWIHRDARARK